MIHKPHVIEGTVWNSNCEGGIIAPTVDYKQLLADDSIEVTLDETWETKLVKNSISGDYDREEFGESDIAKRTIRLSLNAFGAGKEEMVEKTIVHELTHIGERAGHGTPGFRWYTYFFVKQPRYSDLRIGFTGYNPRAEDPIQEVGIDDPQDPIEFGLPPR